MRAPPTKKDIRSISELTSGIKRLLEDHFPVVWVKGEVSNIRHQSSGHIYFSLKDTGASISAVMFRGNASKLSFKIKDGMELVALGNLSVYEPRGTYQLIIRECLEDGAGRLQAEFERLKQRLSAEGLFDVARKKKLPALPRTIAIITSPTGAALRDFLSILNRRNWKGNVIVFPAIVQGKEGGSDILEKIRWVQEYENIDLLVLSRGGGSIEDLWNFNEESVVRAVASSMIPTISAVGHEIDFVLTDFSSDKRAETPSAAAELISSGYVDVLQRIQQGQQSLKREFQNQLQEKSQSTLTLEHRLQNQSPARIIENRHLRLDELQERLKAYQKSGLQQKTNSINLLNERLKPLHPASIIERRQEQLLLLGQRVTREMSVLLKSRQQWIDGVEKRFASLGVESVLKRGYAIIRDSADKTIHTKSDNLKDGMDVWIQLSDGKRQASIRNAQQMDLFQ